MSQQIQRFRLTGAPLELGIKSIEIDTKNSISEVKEKVQEAYKLNKLLAIQFIFHGKVLADTSIFSKLHITSTDVITVMATQAGGGGRNPSFANAMEELGLGDELPDTPQSYVRSISKTVISEIEYADISDLIERRSERLVNSLEGGETMTISEYPIVTENPDVSFACNPWCEGVLSGHLIERIKEAHKRVKLDF